MQKSKFRQIVENSFKNSSLLRYRLSEEQRKLLEKELDESFSLKEVNLDLLNANNYISEDLFNLIIDAIKKENYKPLPYKVNNSYALQLNIDDKRFPKILLVDLNKDKYGEYIPRANSILLDLLDDTNEIDTFKYRDFKNDIGSFIVSHELAHDDQYKFLKSINKSNTYFNNKPYEDDFTENYAFRQQISKMIAYHFRKEIKRNIELNPQLPLKEIFYDTVNGIVYTLFNTHTLTNNFLKRVNKKNKNKVLNYIYAMCKQLFIDNHDMITWWYEEEKYKKVD